MSTEPLVSIITLNYNQAAVTCEFLTSCSYLNYDNYEIHVCDMHSKEDLRAFVEKDKFDKTTFHYSQKNLGFAGGNNWGMQFAKGEYLLLLNNDTEVKPDLIEKLLVPFYLDPLTGVACPKINYFEDKHLIQYAGFTPMSFLTGRTKAIGNKKTDTGQYNRIAETHGAHGAAMMVKREVVSRVGSFPASFFLYYEEWDWSTRIQRAGYKIYFQGNTTVYHKESISVGKANPMKEYYLTRNRIWYMRRNANGIRLFVFYVFYTLFTIPKTTIKHLLMRKKAFLKAFFKGTKDSFKLPNSSLV